jgi:hypothetical protein
MDWQFWKRQPEPKLPTDPWTLVVAPLYLFLENKTPFADWKKPSVSFPPDVESTARFATQGFQFCIYYWKLSNKFGPQSGRFAREACFALLGRLDSESNLRAQVEALCSLIDSAIQAGAGAAEKPVTINGKEIPVPIEYPMALYLLARMRDSLYCGREDVPNEIAIALAECLEHGREIADPLYEHLLSALPSLDGSGFQAWRFSAQPGAHERHLQRRHNNLLFPLARREVSAAEALSARIKDAQALETARNNVRRIHQEFESGAWAFDLDATRQLIEAAQEQVIGAGGDTAGLEEVLREWRKVVIDAWRAQLSDNPEKLERLDSAESLHAKNQTVRLTSFNCQLTNDSGAIPKDEIVPAVLCEAPAVVGAFLEALPEDVRQTAREAATDVALTAAMEGFDVQTIEQQLRALGVRRESAT